MTPQPPSLFHPAYAEPIDPSSQVDRMPGTVDAPCLCDDRFYSTPFFNTTCRWPWCPWKPPNEEDE